MRGWRGLPALRFGAYPMPARAHIGRWDLDGKISWFVHVIQRPASRIECHPGRLVDHGDPERLKQRPERTLAALEKGVRDSAGGRDTQEAGERPEAVTVLQRDAVDAILDSHTQHLEQDPGRQLRHVTAGHESQIRRYRLQPRLDARERPFTLSSVPNEAHLGAHGDRRLRHVRSEHDDDLGAHFSEA